MKMYRYYARRGYCAAACTLSVFLTWIILPRMFTISQMRLIVWLFCMAGFLVSAGVTFWFAQRACLQLVEVLRSHGLEETFPTEVSKHIGLSRWCLGPFFIYITYVNIADDEPRL